MRARSRPCFRPRDRQERLCIWGRSRLIHALYAERQVVELNDAGCICADPQGHLLGILLYTGYQFHVRPIAAGGEGGGDHSRFSRSIHHCQPGSDAALRARFARGASRAQPTKVMRRAGWKMKGGMSLCMAVC